MKSTNHQYLLEWPFSSSELARSYCVPLTQVLFTSSYESAMLLFSALAACSPETTKEDVEEAGRMKSKSGPPKQPKHATRCDEEVKEEVKEEEEEEEEVKVEWPAGVPQASDTDLAKLCHVDGVRKPAHLQSVTRTCN